MTISSYLLVATLAAATAAQPAGKPRATDDRDCLETEQGRRNAAQGAVLGGLLGALVGDQLDENDDSGTTVGALVGAAIGGAAGCETGERQAEYASAEGDNQAYIDQLEAQTFVSEKIASDLEQERLSLLEQIDAAERARLAERTRYDQLVASIDAQRTDASNRLPQVEADLDRLADFMGERRRAGAGGEEIAILERNYAALSAARARLWEISNAPRP